MWLRVVRSMRFYKIMNITLSNCQLNENLYKCALQRHIDVENSFAGLAFLDGEMPAMKPDDLFAET